MPPAPQSPYQTPLYPWGAPPPAQPEKSRVGLMLGIIGGIFLLIVALLATLIVVGKKIDSTYPRAEFALTVPKALDGRFKLARDDSPTLGRTLQRSWRLSWDAKAVHGVAAVYYPDSGDHQGQLVVMGLYGRFKNTDLVRAHVLADSDTRTSRAKLVVAPRDVTPSGSRIKVSCEVLTRTWTDGLTLTYPVCAWVDGNTWARVADMTHDTMVNVDLKASARTTLRIRSEMVKPVR